MPRTKAFDPDAVLDRAVALFWARGFDAVSVQDLVDHLGISRSSLYATYGDKQALWLAALDRYRQRQRDEERQMLDAGAAPLAALRQFFQSVVDHNAADAERRGCLLANATVERGPTDLETARRGKAALKELQQTFERVLRQGQETGELDAERDARALGRYLANAIYGMRSTARLGPPRAVLQDVADQTLRALI